MVYKIFHLIKADEIEPLWSPIMTKVVNEDNSVSIVEYSTESVETLETKMEELVEVYGSDTLRVVSDVTYNVDVNVQTE